MSSKPLLRKLDFVILGAMAVLLLGAMIVGIMIWKRWDAEPPADVELWMFPVMIGASSVATFLARQLKTPEQGEVNDSEEEPEADPG